MKKLFQYALLFAVAGSLSTGFASCSSNDNNDKKLEEAKKKAEEQDKEIQSLTATYLNNVVYPTYTNLAKEADKLLDKITALKANLKANKAVEQSEIDAICASYKAARAFWEESEAFLYGAASDFEIDPHIDSWPLDVAVLAKDLAQDSKIAALDNINNVDVARKNLTKANLGFHGIEFIFFRDGKNRSKDFFNNDATESFEDYFKDKNVTAKEEVIYATAVAVDLRDKCYQLIVSWQGDKAPAAYVKRIAECAKALGDFQTTTKAGVSYGEDLLLAGTPKSKFNVWKKVAENTLVGGCSNICAEVADQKMGQAYRSATHTGTEEDSPEYIESPYSYNSYTDFYGNIQSIQNSLYGNYNQTKYEANSLMAYLTKYNPTMATSLQQKLLAALLALEACQKSGKAFVQEPGTVLVKTAMDAIEELDKELKGAAEWILKN